MSVAKNSHAKHYKQRDPDGIVLTHAHAVTLELMFKGYQAKEIAAMVERTPKTIEFHIHQLLEKTKTRNRVELLYEALARQWLKAPEPYARVQDVLFTRRAAHVD